MGRFRLVRKRTSQERRRLVPPVRHKISIGAGVFENFWLFLQNLVNSYLVYLNLVAESKNVEEGLFGTIFTASEKINSDIVICLCKKTRDYKGVSRKIFVFHNFFSRFPS